MARRRSSAPEEAFIAVEEILKRLKGSLHDKLAESGLFDRMLTQYFIPSIVNKKLPPLLMESRLQQPWQIILNASEPRGRTLGQEFLDYRLVPFVIALTSLVMPLKVYKSTRDDERQRLVRISENASQLVSLIDELDSTFGKTVELSFDIFDGEGSEVLRGSLHRLALNAKKAQVKYEPAITEAISSRKPSKGDSKGHIRYLVTALNSDYGVVLFNTDMRKAIAAFIDALIDSEDGVTTSDVSRIIKSDYPDWYV